VSRRLASLDALRGFDMFWITGGSALVAALAESTDSALLDWVHAQTEHVEWHGFRLWDLVFPLFLFLAGVSMPFSMAKRIARGDSRRKLLLDAARRAALLVLLGAVYNGLLTFDLENQRWASVLGRIGLAWFGAAVIFLSTGVRGQIAWAAGLLLGYWAALSWIPVPGVGAGDLSPGNTLTDWIDRLLVPGRLHRGNRDPEGLFSTVPAIATALAGVFAGHWLRGTAEGTTKALRLFVAGAICLAVGWTWSLVFPFNKNLWTSSFAVWCAGLSLLLLGAFYLVIDVWGLKRWAFFFVVIGTNAITIYMLGAFVDWWAIALLVVDENRFHPALLALVVIGLQWSLLYTLWRRRLFLRV